MVAARAVVSRRVATLVGEAEIDRPYFYCVPCGQGFFPRTTDIFIGVNALDYSGYPDCRSNYIEAFERMANLATKASVEGQQGIKIHTPPIRLSKADIIHRGLELGIDYS